MSRRSREEEAGRVGIKEIRGRALGKGGRGRFRCWLGRRKGRTVTMKEVRANPDQGLSNCTIETPGESL